MRNEAQPAADAGVNAEARLAAPDPAPAPPPLVILAADDDFVCVDDTCLPAEATR